MLGRGVDQLRDPPEAVEEAELRVDVEVGEVVRGDGHGRPMVSPPASGPAVAGVGCTDGGDPTTGSRRRPRGARRRRPRARCPTEFRERLGSVAIVIEDEASPAQLASVGARGLFGLYQGVPRTDVRRGERADPEQDHDLPRAAARARTGRPSALAAGVTDTVHHEIAHHFGISDARLHELQAGRGSR